MATSGSGSESLRHRVDAVTAWQSREWETELSLTPGQLIGAAAVVGGLAGVGYVLGTRNTQVRGAIAGAAFGVTLPAAWEVVRAVATPKNEARMFTSRSATRFALGGALGGLLIDGRLA